MAESADIAMMKLIVLSFLFYIASASFFGKDMRFDNNVFFTYKGIESAFVCGMLCMQSSRCEAFNFRQENSTCSFVDQSESSAVVSDLGYLYSNITKWDLKIAGQCETKPCDSNSFCVPSVTSYNCITAAWAL